MCCYVWAHMCVHMCACGGLELMSEVILKQRSLDFVY